LPVACQVNGGNVGIGTADPAVKLDVDARGVDLPALNISADGNAWGATVTLNDSSDIGRKLYVSSQKGRFSVADESDELLTLSSTNNLGVGTSAPGAKIDINNTDIDQPGLRIVSKYPAYGAGIALKDLSAGEKEYFICYKEGNFVISHNNKALLWITESGLVQIGNGPSGKEKLTVHGDAKVEGTLSVTTDILLEGADCAEHFTIADISGVEPGTVMIIDDECALKPCQSAYDKRAAGVVSGGGNYRPGIILDQQAHIEGRLPIALVGKVFCKVDAEFGAIEPGDILTTSPTPGHAMKASDPMQAFGAVIGKALRPLARGRGEIPILVALQ
jgi:hypothetical protein